MSELWARILAWFAANLPPGHFSAAPGASEDELNKAESRFGVRFPDDVRESYLLHNGAGRDGAFFENYSLMSLDEILEQWRIIDDALEAIELGEMDDLDVCAKPTGPIKKVWWNRRWIPILADATGGSLSVDLDPAPGGKVGQVIEFVHGYGPMWVLAGSFREWLSKYAGDLEAGKYLFDPDSGNISKIKD
jgi:cell wall assembly regulator SMI1